MGSTPGSAGSTTCSKEAIRAALEEARRRTLELLAPLTHEDLVDQHSTIMSPLVWDLAHIGYFEELWLLEQIAGADPVRPRFGDVYDAFAHERSERTVLPLLSPQETRDYVAEVRRRTLEALDGIELDPGSPLLRDGFVYGMVVQHEHQHVETMLATIALRTAGRPYPLRETLDAPWKPVDAPEVFVDAGPFVMGTDDEPWAYDNERPAHEVDLPAFWIDTTPVTVAAFRDFVEAGGYERPGWWSAEGWAWRQEAGLEHPHFWRREANGSWSVLRLGTRLPIDAREPVQHVSWYEADAYARWAGKRLPSEAEWEKAASWDPATGKRSFPWGSQMPEAEHANLERRRHGPAPAGSFPAGASPWGCRQVIGDVWEWTASDFLPYPDFHPFPYREYSEAFFGSAYKVLRGGSWATHPAAIRTTFRNWDFPIRRQIFVGFRCARDA